jgi:hypothetical protein
MKRPQFSLRLLLLVTALIAAIVGWRVAVRDKKHAEAYYQLKELRGQLENCRALLAKAEGGIADHQLPLREDSQPGDDPAILINVLEKDIEEIESR